MRITADTNVLARALVQDNPVQARAVRAGVGAAAGVSLQLQDCIGAIEALLASASVRVDRPAVRAGLQLLGATNWRPLTRRQHGFWLQPVSRCVCFFELISGLPSEPPGA